LVLRSRLVDRPPDDEKRILLESPGRSSDALSALSPVLRVADVRALQEAADRVHFEPELAEYVVAVARETRRSPHLALGVSPRGELSLRNAAPAAPLADGRDYVPPDDLKGLALPVLAHRGGPAPPADGLRGAPPDRERTA